MAAQNYTLPPALGVENDLYEAYPAKPGSDGFSLPGATISNAAQEPSITYPSLPSDLSQDTSAGVTPIYATATQADTSIGNPAGDYNPFATNPLTGLNNSTPTANFTDPLSGKWLSFLADYVSRAFIVFFGLVFLAGGLYLLAKEQGYSHSELLHK